MKRKVLELLFRGRIWTELYVLRHEITCMGPEEFWENAGEADSKRKIYGILSEAAAGLPEEVLQAVVSLPDILDYFYCLWQQTEDSRICQMRRFLLAGLTGQEDGYMITEEEEDVA